MKQIVNPLSVKGDKEPITSVLRVLASQENHDGSPYDQMIDAADYIDELVQTITNIHNMTVSDKDAHAKVHMIHNLCDKTLEHKQ